MFRTVASLLLCAVVCVAVADLAPAAEGKQAKKGGGGPEQKFKKLDKDGDGKVSLDEMLGLNEGEARQNRQNQFHKLDKNRDGSLTLAEYKSSVKGDGKKGGKNQGKGGGRQGQGQGKRK